MAVGIRGDFEMILGDRQAHRLAVDGSSGRKDNRLSTHPFEERGGGRQIVPPIQPGITNRLSDVAGARAMDNRLDGAPIEYGLREFFLDQGDLRGKRRP